MQERTRRVTTTQPSLPRANKPVMQARNPGSEPQPARPNVPGGRSAGSTPAVRFQRTAEDQKARQASIC